MITKAQRDVLRAMKQLDDEEGSSLYKHRYDNRWLVVHLNSGMVVTTVKPATAKVLVAGGFIAERPSTGVVIHYAITDAGRRALEAQS